MKNKITFRIAILMIVLLGGCSGTSKEEASSDKPLKAINERVEDLNQNVSDYSYAQKEKFVKKMENELARLKKDIIALEEKAKKAGGSAKMEAKTRIQEIKNGTKELEKKINMMKDATEDKWDDIKVKFNESMDGVKDAIEKSRTWISEKIAP